MKALVTGASGFIGSNLIRTLLKKGVSVKAFVRQQSLLKNIEGLDVEFVYGDVRDLDSLKTACQGCHFLFHTAAFYDFWAPDPQIFYDVNVAGTKNVLEAAQQTEVSKIIYTSTVGTIGYHKEPRTPSNEMFFPSNGDLNNHYKQSKFQAEQIAFMFAKQGLPVVIVNPSAPIGPYDAKPTPTGRIIVDFLKRKIPAYVDTGLNIIDVEDVAEGHWLAAQKGKVGERYILGNKNVSLKEIYELIAQLGKTKHPFLKIPYAVAFSLAYVSEGVANILKQRPKISLASVRMAKRPMYFDSTKAVRELSLPQSPIEGAFEKAIRWFKDNGYLDFFS